MSEKPISLSIALGAYLGSNFSSTFGRAESVVGRLGKSLRTTEKKIQMGQALLKAKKSVEIFEAAEARMAGSERYKKGMIEKREMLGKAIRDYEKLGGTVMSAGKEMDKLGRRQKMLAIGMKISDFAPRAKTAAMGAVGIGAAAFGLASSTVTRADNIREDSHKMGIDPVALQELRGVAATAGTGADVLDESIIKMVKNVSEANMSGKGGASDAMAELGLSPAKLSKMAPDQQLDAVADALSKVKNSGDRTRLSMDIFGKSGAGMVNILDGGKKGLDDMRVGIRQTGEIMGHEALDSAGKYKDMLDGTGGAMVGMRTTLGTALLPVLGSLLKLVNDNSGSITKFGEGLGSVVSSLGGLGFILSAFGAIFAVNVVGGVIESIAALHKLGPVIKWINVIMAGNLMLLAIGALLIGTALLITHWDDVKAAVGSAMQWIGEKASPLFTLWDDVKAAFGSAMQWIGEKAVWLWEHTPLGFLIKNASKIGQILSGNASVGDLFSGDSGDAGSGAATKTIAAASANAGNSNTTTNNNTTHAPIAIYPTANQSPQDIASTVEQMFYKRDQQKQRQQRGALYDSPAAAG